MDSIPDEDVCPGTILEEHSRPPSRASTLKNTKLRFSICASPIEYDSQRYFGSEHGRASPDAMSYRSDRARSPRPSITSPTEGHPEAEPLNFFTSRADTFAHYNDSGGPSAQVISIAACHDHQTVFEVTQEDATAPNKIRNIGGLLTNTFIEFMEQSKQQKTLDEMLHFLSDAFSRETEKIHKYCCKCQKNVCNDEVCKTPTEEAASRGQCVSPDCPIPTFPPNPLVTTLTDKRRQTLITL
ncbi:hypothetical protein M408DRAFT_329148 [Serendipita vermifera MAFF 305830]|uniref:Uncharacterized protein n=1 Tax=Serendipita vermifera MAFF 305830 TaxID=933852 RepID=A0A0C3BB66_SERVB|nr:hypothetical protein M408DRAFT_329148 [Serendipita vermifera MAFF 305830]